MHVRIFQCKEWTFDLRIVSLDVFMEQQDPLVKGR